MNSENINTFKKSIMEAANYGHNWIDNPFKHNPDLKRMETFSLKSPYFEVDSSCLCFLLEEAL